MDTCKYHYESDGLLLRVVDSKKNWKDSVDYCHQFGEKLAAINNQKRLNDTLDHLDNCYKTDVHGIRTQVENRMENKFRVGLNFQNGIGSWSDGSPLDVDEQKSLFENGVLPSSDGNTFFIQKNEFHGVRFKPTYNDDSDLPFLCSKSKPAPTTTTEPVSTTESLKTFEITTRYESANSGANMLSTIAFSPTLLFILSLGFVVLVAILLFFVFKLYEKNKKYKQAKKHFVAMEHEAINQKQSEDKDGCYVTVDFKAEQQSQLSIKPANENRCSLIIAPEEDHQTFTDSS